MRKKMQERERRRVLQRFNPDAIRQVAESTADELTRARLLAIVGENLRRTGADRSPQQQQALEELNKASHESVGARRVRYVFVCVRARERCPVRLHRQTRLTVFVYLHSSLIALRSAINLSFLVVVIVACLPAVAWTVFKQAEWVKAQCCSFTTGA